MMEGIKRHQQYPALFGLFAELPIDDEEGWTAQETEEWIEAVALMARRSIPRATESPQEGQGQGEA